VGWKVVVGLNLSCEVFLVQLQVDRQIFSDYRVCAGTERYCVVKLLNEGLHAFWFFDPIGQIGVVEFNNDSSVS
jgi:hypothetical protein